MSIHPRNARDRTNEQMLEHCQRELRTRIAEAERRGDYAELAMLTQQKLELDRALRELHRRQHGPEV